MWNDLPYTVFDNRTLDRFKGVVNSWLLNSPSCVFSAFSWAGACGVAKAIYKQFYFSHVGCVVVLLILIIIMIKKSF